MQGRGEVVSPIKAHFRANASVRLTRSHGSGLCLTTGNPVFARRASRPYPTAEVLLVPFFRAADRDRPRYPASVVIASDTLLRSSKKSRNRFDTNQEGLIEAGCTWLDGGHCVLRMLMFNQGCMGM